MSKDLRKVDFLLALQGDQYREELLRVVSLFNPPYMQWYYPNFDRTQNHYIIAHIIQTFTKC